MNFFIGREDLPFSHLYIQTRYLRLDSGVWGSALPVRGTYKFVTCAVGGTLCPCLTGWDFQQPNRGILQHRVAREFGVGVAARAWAARRRFGSYVVRGLGCAPIRVAPMAALRILRLGRSLERHRGSLGAAGLLAIPAIYRQNESGSDVGRSRSANPSAGCSLGIVLVA